MTAAVAPGGLMDTHKTDGVKSAVLTAVNNILNKVRPRVQETVDDIFVSYRDCVLSERSEAELALEAHRSLVDTGLHTSVGTIMSDFQQFVNTAISDNISKLEEAVRTATTAFDTRQTSIVESINAAHRASTLRPPTSTHVCLAQSPRTTSEDTPAAAQPPPSTGLELLLDNVTPLGASRAAHASTAAYTVDKHRCQLGHYDRSALAGIYVYLQKCMTGSTVSACGDIRRTDPRLHFPTYDRLCMVRSPRLGAEPGSGGNRQVDRSE
jgi:hypothetical protein